jgi:hypothetical protein
VANTYLVNGVDLTTFATRIATAEGLQDSADPTQGFIDMPGLDGVLDPFSSPGLPRPPDGIATITFDMWLKGVSASTGLVPGGSTTERQYYQRWDELVKLFYRRSLLIDHVGPAGQRRAVGRLQSGMRPSRFISSPWFGRMKVTLMIPSGYWADLNAVSTGVQQVANNGSLDLSVFADATAPCTDLLVRINGAATNPKLTTPYNTYLGWNGSIVSGRMVEFNTADGTIGPGSGAAWTPGYAHDYGPGPLYFEVDPSEALTATLTHAGAGTVGVEVIGRRHYRTSGGGALAGTGYGRGSYGIQPYGV